MFLELMEHGRFTLKRWGLLDAYKSTVPWLVGILSFNGSQILPQGTENLDNTEITESCLETMEEPEDQGS
jgi:hypothetical protein